MDNGKNAWNLGRKTKTQNFRENTIFFFFFFFFFLCRKLRNTENTVENTLKSIKKKKRNSAFTQKIWIKLVRSVYACFSCHVFSIQCIVWAMYIEHAEWNQDFIIALLCILYMSPKITEFEEHTRTRIWHFRKKKTGDFSIDSDT